MDKTGNYCCYLYLSYAGGADYALLMHNCPETNYQTQPSRIDPARDSGSNRCIVDGSSIWSWKVYSAGGLCW